MRTYCIILLLFMLSVPIFVKSAGAENEAKIVSLSPNITEILHTLDLDRHVVGVTEHCHVESLKKSAQSIGTFFSPNLEQIVLLQPDLVIGLPTHGTLMGKLKNVLPEASFLIVRNESISDVMSSLDSIGEATETTARAQDVKKRLKAKIDTYTSMTERLPTRASVLFVVSHTPSELHQIYAAGRNTFINELLEVVGGKNVIVVSTPRYPIISREAVISLNPEVIIDTAVRDDATTQAVTAAEQAWNTLHQVRAVKNNRVYVIRDNRLTIPAPESILHSLDTLYRILGTP